MKKPLSNIYYDAIAELTNKTGFSVDVNLKITNLDNPPSNDLILKKAKEIEAKEPMRLLRLERNRRLAETDWRMVEDYPMANKLDWKTYRQTLRDLPKMIIPDDSTEPLPAPTIDQQGQLIFLHWPEVPA